MIKYSIKGISQRCKYIKGSSQNLACIAIDGYYCSPCYDLEQNIHATKINYQ
jgi:hypothetical protein